MGRLGHRDEENRGMPRRTFLASATAALAAGVLPGRVRANVAAAYDWSIAPPTDTRSRYVDWMVKNRGEDARYLGLRYDRFVWMVNTGGDMWGNRNKRAFLLTPREEFCLEENLPHVYDIASLDIGFGVSITGPGLVSRMTCSLDVQMGERVLEIGNGSGYQSAFLANLTDQVWTIEVIPQLFKRTGGIYADLIRRGYVEYRAISRMQGDGYYGWEAVAPFDKILVTCGIDHIPPPLLQQLKASGIMVIPIGPPGAQHILKIVKHEDAKGNVTVSRSDVFGTVIPFVPFTNPNGGTHDLSPAAK
jgi:protein-L-isoaspartate(D-aspartate) O-methyltransferase